MAESFNPIVAGGEGENSFSQSNPLFDEKRLSKRGLVAKEGEDLEGGRGGSLAVHCPA